MGRKKTVEKNKSPNMGTLEVTIKTDNEFFNNDTVDEYLKFLDTSSMLEWSGRGTDLDEQRIDVFYNILYNINFNLILKYNIPPYIQVKIYKNNM